MVMTPEEKSERMKAIASLMDSVANAKTDGLVKEEDAKNLCGKCVTNTMNMLNDW